jgi:hypothetical protein
MTSLSPRPLRSGWNRFGLRFRLDSRSRLNRLDSQTSSNEQAANAPAPDVVLAIEPAVDTSGVALKNSHLLGDGDQITDRHAAIHNPREDDLPQIHAILQVSPMPWRDGCV